MFNSVYMRNEQVYIYSLILMILTVISEKIASYYVDNIRINSRVFLAINMSHFKILD